MNQLNSVLLEGEVSKIIKSERKEGLKSSFIFKINTRSYKKTESGEVEKIENTFEIATEKRLAEVCGEHLSIGRGVRIIGRLAVKPDEERSVFIQAEHVEFKPERKEINEDKGEEACSKQEM